MGVLAGSACVPGPVVPTDPDCTVTGHETRADLRYARSPGTAATLQSLDLYLPTREAGCGPVPTVVYVHGGGFQIGDKANRIDDKVRLFTAQGWAFASVNYRLVGHPGAGPAGATYPAAEQDVADAVAFLADHAADHGLDPGATMLLGHSSGAFLVALVGTDGRFLADAGPGLAGVACVAPLDATYDIAAQIARGGTEEAMYRAAFGDDPAVWEQASPITHVAPGTGIPPFHLVTRGTAPRIAQSRALADALLAAGVPATAHVVHGLSHEEVNEAVGLPGDQVVTPPLLAFLTTCAGP
jgi:acetyl esterase/lipase